MTVRDPEQLYRLFAERASSGDLDGLLALYEHGATFVGPDGEHAVGEGAIRERLRDLLAVAPLVTPAGNQGMVVAEDIALLSNRWRMTWGSGESVPFVEGSSTEVARRQPDGGWLYVIDHPVIDNLVPEGTPPRP